jgi:phage-related holin
VEDKFLSISAVVVGLFTFCFGYVGELLILVPVTLIIDYVLGLTAHIYKGGTFNKELGLWGLVRKLGYFIIIIGSLMLDFIINWLTIKAGINLPIKNIFVLATTVYLLAIEWGSILRHCKTLKIPTPAFLVKAFMKVKVESETIGEGSGKKDGNK